MNFGKVKEFFELTNAGQLIDIRDEDLKMIRQHGGENFAHAWVFILTLFTHICKRKLCFPISFKDSLAFSQYLVSDFEGDKKPKGVNEMGLG